MRFDESSNLRATDLPLAVDLELPVFTERQREHWPLPMSWAQAMRHFAGARADYMRDFDSPDARLRSKNRAPFELP